MIFGNASLLVRLGTLLEVVVEYGTEIGIFGPAPVSVLVLTSCDGLRWHVRKDLPSDKPYPVIVPVLGITMTAMNRDELWGASCESTGF